MRRIPEEMTTRARTLRRESTPAERLLWHQLSHYRPRFTRQLVVERFILDLACREAKLAVELDGSQHVDTAEHDAERTRRLETLGWRVIRFWNGEVLTNSTGCTELILATAAECLGGTHPQPLPCREGRRRAST